MSSAMRTQHTLGHRSVEIGNEMSIGYVWASSFASRSPAFPVCADSLELLGRREVGKRPRIESDGNDVNSIGAVFANLQ